MTRREIISVHRRRRRSKGPPPATQQNLDRSNPIARQLKLVPLLCHYCIAIDIAAAVDIKALEPGDTYSYIYAHSFSTDSFLYCVSGRGY